MIILADSGVLLRLYDPSDPWHTDAVRSVTVFKARNDQIVTASQNIREFWNACTRPSTARNGLGLSISETNRRITILENAYAILDDDSTTFSNWKQLVLLHAVKGKQVYDANLVALMKTHGIDTILTFNCQDFTRYPGIIAIDPRNV